MVDVSTTQIDIDRNLRMQPKQRTEGPPERMDGISVGIIEMSSSAPHGGEIHPDGDEFIYVISGSLRITSDSQSESVTLNAGQSCIIGANEWHKVDVLSPTKLLHMTPGPNGDHRPLPG